MARRLLKAEAGFRSLPPLQVDDRLEIQWQHLFREDDWSGEITITPPTYEISRFGEKFGFSNYGTLIDEEGIAWLKSVLDRSDGANPPDYLARVHEVHLNEQKEAEYFRIEVLTGEDAKALLAAKKAAAQFDFLKDNWWKIGIGLIFIYWWLF